VAEAVEDGRAADAFEAAREAARALDVPGVERSGGRCVLPTLVVRADGAARAVSGVTDFGAVREAFEAVAGAEPVGTTPDVGSVIERFSAEGWVSRAELARLTGRGAEAVEARAGELVDSGDVVGATFAAEPFWRLRAFTPDKRRESEHGRDDGAEAGVDSGESPTDRSGSS
jgi:hypothetical protein